MMKNSDVLVEILNDINSVEEKRLARTIYKSSQRYDDLVLSQPVVPDEFVDFLLKFFSCGRVQGSKGIEYFLLELNVDFCKYTPPQKEKILANLIANAGYFNDQLGRHSIGDFIARAYDPEIAFPALQSLALGTPKEKHVAFVGFDVLRMRARRDIKNPKLLNKIMKDWEELGRTGFDL